MKTIKLLIATLILMSGFQLNAQIEEPVKEMQSEVFIVVEQMPEFPGGEKARNEFIIKNIKYPQEALENEVQGIVYVSFVVSKEGKLTNVQIKRGIGFGCDKECLRLVESMPNWAPGMQNGDKVPVEMMLPIKFHLN